MNKLELIRSIFWDKSWDFWDKCFSPFLTSKTWEIEFDILQFEDFLINEYGYNPETPIKEFCDGKFWEWKIELIFNI